MWNMDEKGFILGTANRAKVIARAGRRPPRTTHDGTRELITVIEAPIIQKTRRIRTHVKIP